MRVVLINGSQRNHSTIMPVLLRGLSGLNDNEKLIAYFYLQDGFINVRLTLI